MSKAKQLIEELQSEIQETLGLSEDKRQEIMDKLMKEFATMYNSGMGSKDLVSNMNQFGEMAGMSFSNALKFSDATDKVFKALRKDGVDKVNSKDVLTLLKLALQGKIEQRKKA